MEKIDYTFIVPTKGQLCTPLTPMFIPFDIVQASLVRWAFIDRTYTPRNTLAGAAVRRRLAITDQ